MANNQTTRFIDVTRTFIPVNPNAFPDSLHEYQRTDIESRIPVMAYQGFNFLPTAYGYKSYFGINQDIGVLALAERVDHIFIYQNNSFENILIALCDSGIWYKSASVAGAWAQVLTLDHHRDSLLHYEWTYAIINDALYCYRQNGPSYQKIVSNASAPGFTLTSVVPNFLNMEAQMGIFRAGARLGFWDSSDSTAWSNLDDFADFTPSIETLANATVFSGVVGRIVTIKSHGEGFMIYATKSVLYVREAPESLFQFDPLRILDVAGIAYPKEVVAAVPDNIHYMYSSVGMYRITNANPEIIVPEVTDYFKESKGPKYLEFLEGRYLFIQSLDADYMNGLPQFSDELIPATIITFPGQNLNLLGEIEDAYTNGSAGFCPILNGLSNGAFQQPEDEDPSIVWRPVYTAYLSYGNNMGEDIAWQTAPCSVTNVLTTVPYAMSPTTGGSWDKLSTDDTNKRVVTGPEAYVDGNWTIERFVQAQTAIWQIEQNALSAFITQLLSRTHQSQLVEEVPTEPAISTVVTECSIGNFVTAYGGPQFGFSECEFWLTRQALAAIEAKVVVTTRVTKEFVPQHDTSPIPSFAQVTSISTGDGPSVDPTCYGSTNYANIAAALAAARACYAAAGGTDSTNCDSYEETFGGTPYSLLATAVCQSNYVEFRNFRAAMTQNYTCPPGYSTVGGGSNACRKPAFWRKTTTRTAYIKGIAIPAPLKFDTGYCRLTGWKDIVSETTIAAATCSSPPLVPPGSERGEATKNPVNIGDDGTFCSKPFDPFEIPGTPAVIINWPPQTVVIPAGSYFLQDGSAAPLYPTFEGAWVYDVHLKKWGLYKGRHKRLMDYSPINSFGPSEQSYSRFGIMGGILAEGGKLYVFDAFPSDSKIAYGKIGYYRQGVTSVEEAHVHMKSQCDGTITVETSLDGKNVTTGLSKTEIYTAETKITFYGGYTGRWHNVVLQGRFDISYMEFRGIISGKR